MMDSDAKLIYVTLKLKQIEKTDLLYIASEVEALVNKLDEWQDEERTFTAAEHQTSVRFDCSIGRLMTVYG